MTQLICRVVIGVGGCWAAYLNASEPLIWATASPQPALVSDQAASRLAPTGFDQALGRGR
jgi:hypothetical protein